MPTANVINASSRSRRHFIDQVCDCRSAGPAFGMSPDARARDTCALNKVDPRLIAALRLQLSKRPPNAVRVGWKYGSGDDERIGGEIAVGHLIAERTLEDASIYSGGGADLHADVELAVEIGDNAGIRRYGLRLKSAISLMAAARKRSSRRMTTTEQSLSARLPKNAQPVWRGRSSSTATSAPLGSRPHRKR
jgi:hypothetical protein